MGLPRLIEPMLVSLRHEFPADEESYGWELKWDGLRAVAYVEDGKVRLVSRNDKDMAASYPELGVLTERAGAPVILDGEIVALRHGRPDFGLLQSRMHVLRPEDKLLRAAPVQYYVFDLLHHGEESLLGSPYTERRARLEDLGLDADPVHTPPWHRGGRTGGAGREHREGPGGSGGQAAGFGLPSGPAAGLDQDQERQTAGGHHRWLEARARAAARTRSDRCCSASTTTTAGCATPDTSAPASPTTC